MLPAFIQRAELGDVRFEVDAALREPLPPGCSRPHNTLAPLRWDSPLIERVLANDRRVRAIATATEACDLRWISGYISLKEAHSPALWWHQDWWCWEHPVSFRPAAPQVALLCYLTHTGVTSAALRVLPGSHRRSIPLHAALPEAHAQATGEIDPEHPAMRDHQKQETLTFDSGDAAVIDYRLLHGTHPNRSNARRACLILTFTPGWRLLPAEIRAHLIRHPALPGADEGEFSPPYPKHLLPDFAGTRRDLPLSRGAPASFAIADG